MEEIRAFRSLDGTIFADENQCLLYDNKFTAIKEKYTKLVRGFASTLSYDVGHSGPKDRDDESESSRFNHYKEKLIMYLTKCEINSA